MTGKNKDVIAILIKKASLESEKVQLPLLQEYDLSVAQFKFLTKLYASPKDSVRVADLEIEFSMTHPAVIDILKLLEKKGYTTRIANPQDGRSKIISLTKKAYDRQQELNALGTTMEKAVTKNLNAAEQKQLATLLRKMMGT